ncbi:MAG TPA: hypothetical protein VLX85_12870 [Stellaceae bacterium]|nr:hypothetical protein [Stellaceae bacterium]
MTGKDLAEWRRRNGYSQQQLMQELEVKSRQTISTWERPDRRLERPIELALILLERDPSLRRIAGRKATAQQAKEAREFLSTGRT